MLLCLNLCIPKHKSGRLIPLPLAKAEGSPLFCVVMRVKTENGCKIRPTSQSEFSENSDTLQDTRSEPIRNSIEIDDPVVFENLQNIYFLF